MHVQKGQMVSKLPFDNDKPSKDQYSVFGYFLHLMKFECSDQLLETNRLE